MERISGEELKLLMDFWKLNDRQVSQKFGVSHSTVIRWRSVDHKMPFPVCIAIDSIFGNGKQGSALEKVTFDLRKRWHDYVVGLSQSDLLQISCGYYAIQYADGDFELVHYSEDEPCFVYVGDVCGVNGPSHWGIRVIEEILKDDMQDPLEWFGDDLDNDRNAECQELHLIRSLVAESERSEMLRYDIKRRVLEMIYDVEVGNLDDEVLLEAEDGSN